MPWQTQQQQNPWTQNLRPSSSQYALSSGKKKKNILTLNTIFPFSPFPSFPFVSSLSNLCLESQQSSSVKAVCSTHHQHFYRSSARQWWFVPVLRQNYFLPLSQYRLLPLSRAIPPADTKKKKKKTWGGGEEGWRNFTLPLYMNCWWDLSDNLVCNYQCQSQRHCHVWFPSCGAKL